MKELICSNIRYIFLLVITCFPRLYKAVTSRSKTIEFSREQFNIDALGYCLSGAVRTSIPRFFVVQFLGVLIINDGVWRSSVCVLFRCTVEDLVFHPSSNDPVTSVFNSQTARFRAQCCAIIYL